MLRRFDSLFKRYIDNTSGQFAIMVAVCLTGLLICIGSAIDMIGMQKHRNELQALTDGAALAAASLKTDNISEMKKAADAVLVANSTDKAIKLNLSVRGEDIIVEASLPYSTQLMGIVGIGKLPVSATSEAPIPKGVPLNVALVLDTTGSMNGANMTALKSASKILLKVFDETDPGLIQAGVVPYAKYVNIGMDNRNRSWMDVPEDSSTTGDEKCVMRKDIVDVNLCTTTTSDNICYNDSGAYDCTRSSRSCPAEAYGPEYEYCYTPTSTQTWKGCVGSRDDPWHKTPEYSGKKFPGIMNTSCGSELLDLTGNLAVVGDKIDSLIATGNTYIPSGLIWGHRMLDPSLPLGGLTNNQDDRKRALILMTDGSNTVRLSAPHHSDDLQKNEVLATNAITAELCKGIKEDGIDLYSVAYKLGTGDPIAEKMIADCATSPSYFFSADNQAQLEQAFEDIARSLFEVRLSK